jgi:hypothetical protein
VNHLPDQQEQFPVEEWDAAFPPEDFDHWAHLVLDTVIKYLEQHGT